MAKAKAPPLDARAYFSQRAAADASSAALKRRAVIVVLGALIAFVAAQFFAQMRSDDRLRPMELMTLEAGRVDVACLEDYSQVAGCSPPSRCGRLVVDDFLSAAEVATLRTMADAGMRFGSGAGGPTIFDVATGAASRDAAFVDSFALMQAAHDQAMAKADAQRMGADKITLDTTRAPEPALSILSAKQVALYRTTTARIRALVEQEFGVKNLHLTKPSFFSRIESKSSQTAHDEYWHEHVDKVQYGSFSYTALIYLSDAGRDFKGGEFVFINKDANGTVTGESKALPSKGRLMAFTSGAENAHRVNKVTEGVRFALTVAFTCDEKQSAEKTLLTRADAMLRKQAEWEAKHKKQLEAPGLGAGPGAPLTAEM